jgi:hydroxymethylpyrimidine pyrophosphatase-like HAD family hydrolase
MNDDRVLLMDIDGTLTPPRQSLRREMADALARLQLRFHVAAGSDLALIESQFLNPLWDFGCRRDFEAFLSNGASHYHCPFRERYAVELVEEFNFRRHLGEAGYARLLTVLEAALRLKDFELPASVGVMGRQIIDRGSMLNFAPSGRIQGDLSEEVLANRRAFVIFDEQTGYRRRLLTHLTAELSSLIQEKQLWIMLGGQTSFDVVIRGKEKTHAVRTLLRWGVSRIVFLGDALFDGGNDSVILDFIKDWNQPSACPLTAIRVEGWEHTIEVFKHQGWL